MKNLKVSIVGFGNIGRALAHLLINSDKYCFEINVIDPSSSIEGSILDIGHAAMLKGSAEIILNDWSFLNESEFIFHCVGVGVPMGASRLDIAGQNIKLTIAIFKDFKPKVDSKIIVISNPDDVISHFNYLSTGLSPEKVIGTGTLLDSARMNYYISKVIKHKKDFKAILLGEHGQSIAMINSISKIDGEPIDMVLSQDDIGRCLSNVKTAAHKIKMTQGSSIYGAVDCAVFIMESILEDSQDVLPLSNLLTQNLSELFKTKPLYMSVMSRITKEGCFPIENVKYYPQEIEAMQNCAKVIGQFL